jgi:hypothetical protein
VTAVRLTPARDDHRWAQRHLSHYFEGDLKARARGRLERHAADCADCSRSLRAMKGLLRLLAGVAGHDQVRAPDNIFDRVRNDATASRPVPDLRGSS